MVRRALFLLVMGMFSGLTACGDDGDRGAQVEECRVPAGYLESVEENRDFMLRVLGAVNRPEPAAVNGEQAALFFAGLASSRRHYEELQPDLPACATTLNRHAIDALSATQDLVALQMSRLAAPEWQRVDTHLDQANEHFAQRWAALQETLSSDPWTRRRS